MSALKALIMMITLCILIGLNRNEIIFTIDDPLLTLISIMTFIKQLLVNAMQSLDPSGVGYFYGFPMRHTHHYTTTELLLLIVNIVVWPVFIILCIWTMFLRCRLFFARRRNNN